MNRGLRQAVLSAVVFAGVVLAVVSVDPRVRDRVAAIATGSDGLTPWGDQFAHLGTALVDAVRYQSIENAPLVIFATVGAVLFVFMFRT